MITLIGKNIAKEGLSFVFYGPLEECSNCRFKSSCVDSLEIGRKYAITEVRDVEQKCPIHEDAYYGQRFKESDGAFYYCDEGKWKPTKLIPQQYTDPRKKGLTDEEYDVLDLPKEASVNDRAAGLLEDCWDKDVLLAQKLEHNDDIGFQYSYCLPQNYYRYREDGTWTLETTDEEIADELLHNTVCSKSEDPQSVRDTIPAHRYRLSRVVGCKDNSNVISFIYPEKKAQ